MPGGRLCINIDIPMLSYEEALQKLLTQVPEPKAVRVALRHSRGRVLAGSITADLDLPPFRKSFMDGYAVRSQDVARGVRYITLTHSKNNHICDSSYDSVRKWKGLSPFGRRVVQEM